MDWLRGLIIGALCIISVMVLTAAITLIAPYVAGLVIVVLLIRWMIKNR